jgi:NOL1/NOP2/fmu family ribosome biogenesis protein
MVIDNFLNLHPDFEIIRVKESVESNTENGIFFDGCICENINYARRFYPHKNKGEGQFMAVLRNKSVDTYNQKPCNSKSEKIDKIVYDFLDDVLAEYKKENVRMYNGNPVYISPDIDVSKGIAFSCVVTIGEVRKNYIQPHHQFFMAMGNDFKRKINLTSDSDEIKKYLHGEEISVDCDNGWSVVMVDGCSAGGAKVVSGKAKNHYPKGLRVKY